MADDHPLREPDSSHYQTVSDGEDGPSTDRADDGTAMALSHPPQTPPDIRTTRAGQRLSGPLRP